MGSAFMDFTQVSASVLAEPLAEMLRQVGSGLKFCKHRLKYGCHNSFSTLKFEMAANMVEVYKTTFSSSLSVFFTCLQGFPL